MLKSSLLTAVLFFGIAMTAIAQEETAIQPVELKVIEAYAGVWDAEIEVWPQGMDKPSIKFKGVETNRPYGKHWLASDFDSEINGETMRVHSIVGYDLDQKKLFGMIIDHGPYSATMTGEYDEATKTVTWLTKAKDESGKPMFQKTLLTEKSATERVLKLMVPGEKKDEFNVFMQINFVKRE